MVYIALTLLLGFAAVNTGNNLLYLLVSALLGFMAVSGLLGRWNLARLELRCVPPDELYDGLPTLLGIELHNRRRWLPACLLEVFLGGGQLLLPLVAGGECRRKPLTVVIHGRGWQRLPPVELRSRFPINFFIRRLSLSLDQRLLLFPAPQRFAYPAAASVTAPDRGSRPQARRGIEGEVSHIGDYRGGEPLRQIHWKLSARHEQFKVKEFSAGQHPPVLVELAALPGRDIEEQLRCAAWLISHLLRDGQPVGLRAGTVLLPPALGRPHKLCLLKALALHGRDQTAP